MICPYICNIVQDNQNQYEYDESGQNVAHTHRLVEYKKPMECAKEECAAWRDERCWYNE